MFSKTNRTSSGPTAYYALFETEKILVSDSDILNLLKAYSFYIV